MENRTAEILSFGQLYKDYQAIFVNFATTYVRNRAIAEDITAEAIAYYWENRESLAGVSNIPAYILTVIKNKSLNYLRHIQVHEDYSEVVRMYTKWELATRITSLEACNPEKLYTKEMQALIRKTLENLPERTRKVFVLSRYENKSHKEIAILMNMTTQGVNFHICKALKEFHITLKDYLPLFFCFFLKIH